MEGIYVISLPHGPFIKIYLILILKGPTSLSLTATTTTVAATVILKLAIINQEATIIREIKPKNRQIMVSILMGLFVFFLDWF